MFGSHERRHEESGSEDERPRHHHHRERRSEDEEEEAPREYVEEQPRRGSGSDRGYGRGEDEDRGYGGDRGYGRGDDEDEGRGYGRDRGYGRGEDDGDRGYGRDDDEPRERSRRQESSYEGEGRYERRRESPRRESPPRRAPQEEYHPREHSRSQEESDEGRQYRSEGRREYSERREESGSRHSRGGYSGGGGDLPSRPSYARGESYSRENYRPQKKSSAQQHHEVPQELYLDDPDAVVNPEAEKAERGLGSALESFAGEIGSTLGSIFTGGSSSKTKPMSAEGAGGESGLPEQSTGNRFDSYAHPRTGNGIKWYVDGKDYMYAVSLALERSEESIWILDWWLSPELYLRRPPSANEEYRLDRMLKAAAERGVKINIIVYKEVTQALTLDSHHTKHALEDLHVNISVFRHPDHLPDKETVAHGILEQIQGGLKNYEFGDGMKALYGMKDDVVLYWAHHEKLCIVDGRIAFMGGLDLCFGRWDMNHHPIADVHPQDLGAIVFPGQDYNDARYMDFQHVDKWEDNQVSRLEIPRMGWSDVALSMMGPTVQDLQRHFVQRWNFIFRDKYQVREQERYSLLDESSYSVGGGSMRHRRTFRHPVRGEEEGEEPSHELDGVRLQICRSSSSWSHGLTQTEHSIQEAYIQIIGGAKHFVYMENQFFITATDDKQAPILNKVGRAIVDRILRADRNGERFMIFVVIPAIPGFAGDLKSDDSLGTRAIMEFQYRSICRDRGYSIMEQIAKAGVDPKKYIRFYNLRNYDRINTAGASKGEERSGVPYEAAARQHDREVGGGYGYGGFEEEGSRGEDRERYQRATENRGGEYDSVAACYMLGGPDIREVPWEGDPDKEIDAFVNEELYIHSKLLIADDRVALIGSANLNDRSQLGDHDSEIACIVEDPTPLPSRMNGQPFTAAHFAATLRRQIFRKHLGLIPAQTLSVVDENMQPFPVPNIYDFDSAEDEVVADPLSDEFQQFWNQTARVNTDAFERVFHTVPSDRLHSWKDYEDYWSKYFEKKDLKDPVEEGKEQWGHVVRKEFAAGREGAKQVKEVLSRIRGTLVEMPLDFLRDEDIAKEGLGLNAFTETVYT